MTITSLGSLSVGGVVPGAVTACVEGDAGISAAIPDIQARIAACAQFSPAEISFAAQLTLAGQILASINSCLALGLVPPSISAQIVAMTNLMAELLATLNSVQAHAGVLADLQVSLGAVGVEAYAYDGLVGNLAAELAVELGADSDHCNALIQIVRAPAVWAAFSNIMKVTP